MLFHRISFLALTVLVTMPSTLAAPSSRRGPKGVRDTRAAETRLRSRLLEKSPKEKGTIKGPKGRDCKIEGAVDEVQFDCTANAQNDGEGVTINDGINFMVKAEPRGLVVQVAYQQDVTTQAEVGNETGSGTRYLVGDESVVTAAENSTTSDLEAAGNDTAPSVGHSPSSDNMTAPVHHDAERNNTDHNTTAPHHQPGGNETVQEADNMTATHHEPPGDMTTDDNATVAHQHPPGPNANRTQYEIIFDQVIEYRKGNSSSDGDAFDWNKDNVVQEINLAHWEGNFSEVSTSDDGIFSTFSTSSPDGTLSFTFKISRAQVGEDISANKIKIDVNITNFTWVEDDSYIALLSTIASREMADIAFVDGSGGDPAQSKPATDVTIPFSDVSDEVGFVPYGEYTWATTALAKDTTIDVVATSPLDGRSEKVAFSFVGDGAHSTEIYWDPEVGVGYGYGSASTRAGLASAAVLIVGAFGSALLLVL